MMENLGIYFAHGDRWPYLLLIPVLVALMFRTAAFRRDILRKLGGLLGTAPGENGAGAFKSGEDEGMIHPRLRPLKHVLFVAGTTALAVAVLGPQWGQKAQTVKAQGLDICFALDLSRSMLAEDASPSRLDQAKNQLSIFLPTLGGDRAALVGFAGTGFVAAPLSNDQAALVGFLEPLNPQFVSDQSTRVASGVDACMTALSLDDVDDRNEISDLAAKLIVIISDGEDQLEDYNDAVARAEKLGVPIYAMAAGSAKGGPIPVRDERGNIAQYVVDGSGQRVVTTLKDKALKEMASKTGGQVFYTSAGIESWKRFTAAIANYKRDSKDAGTKLDREDRFQWPLGLAILLLMLDYLLPEAGFGRRRETLRKAATGVAIALLALGLPRSDAAAQSEAGAPPAGARPPTEMPRPPAVPLLRKTYDRLPTVVAENTWGLIGLSRGDLPKAQKKFEEGIERDASDPILRFNWASTRFFGAVNKEGNANPKIVDESLKEFESLQKELARTVKETRDEARKLEAEDLQKALVYQIAQARELKRDLPGALAAYYQTLATGRTNAGDLDAQAKKNIERLITQASGGGGGGGGQDDQKQGEGGEGEKKESPDGKGDQPEPKKDGEDHKDKKVKPKYSGTEIGEEEARQILESVSGEERDVQKRKAQGEARERSKRDAQEKGFGSASENQW